MSRDLIPSFLPSEGCSGLKLPDDITYTGIDSDGEFLFDIDDDEFLSRIM